MIRNGEWVCDLCSKSLTQKEEIFITMDKDFLPIEVCKNCWEEKV